MFNFESSLNIPYDSLELYSEHLFTYLKNHIAVTRRLYTIQSYQNYLKNRVSTVQLCMAVCFWYLVIRDLSGVRVYSSVHWKVNFYKVPAQLGHVYLVTLHIHMFISMFFCLFIKKAHKGKIFFKKTFLSGEGDGG